MIGAFVLKERPESEERIDENAKPDARHHNFEDCGMGTKRGDDKAGQKETKGCM